MTKFFGIKEIGVFLAVVIFIVAISLFNFKVSFKRERNGLRREDLTHIVGALNKFYLAYGFYPAAIDGKIADCVGPKTIVRRVTKFFQDPAPCFWGKDYFTIDPTDASFPKLLDPIPPDPLITQGYSYVYYSTGSEYQIYASYELRSEADYSKEIEKAKIKCGVAICNTGKASAETPLDKVL